MTTTTPRIIATLATLAAFSLTALFAQEQEQEQPATPQTTQPAQTTQLAAATQQTTPATASDAPAPAAKKRKKRVSKDNDRSGNEIVNFGSDINVPAGTTARSAVAMLGNVHIDGNATEAVAIIGSVTASAPVTQAVSIVGSTTIKAGAHEAVAVIGNVYVNGHVTGQVVAVGGGVELGPDARVDGEVIAIGGPIKRAETASIGGKITQLKIFGDISGFNAWITKALARGRLLAFGSELAWAWIIAGIFLLLYIITAALFPKAVTTCAETMELHPGMVFLAALITVFVKPIIGLLLTATVIGLPVIILASLALAILGKTAFIAWLGRRIAIPLNLSRHPVVAVLISGVPLALLYCTPYIGILFWKFAGFLGTGMVVYAALLVLRRKRDERDAARAAEKAAFAFSPVAAPATASATATSPANTAPSGATPPPLPADPVAAATSAAIAPRAGFWLRAGALLIDVMIVGAVSKYLLGMAANLPVIFAIYCVALWALRGTTLGGVVCGLSIVRADGRAMDWSTALVRAIGGFVAMLPFGLGFFWLAIDADRQGWHDKIAGTIVIHAPKGQALI